MLTRDSWIWLVGLLAAVVGYLMTAQKPPTAWSYMEYLQAASFILAYIVGRLSSSPLAGDKTPLAETKPGLGGILKLTDKG
jgi:hypothetical protein